MDRFVQPTINLLDRYSRFRGSLSDLVLGVSIAPGTSNELGVRVEIMDVSSETLKSYPDPRDRKCYLNEDVSFEVLSI